MYPHNTPIDHGVLMNIKLRNLNLKNKRIYIRQTDYITLLYRKLNINK